MEKRNLARVEDLLREKALLASLRLPEDVLKLLHDPFLRRMTARGLDRSMMLLRKLDESPEAFDEAWRNIGKNDKPPPQE